MSENPKNASRPDGEHGLANIERLLAADDPCLTMPRGDKARILAELIDRSAARTRPPRRGMRRPFASIARSRISLAAAAVLLAVVFLGIWLFGGSTGVAWADVAHRLAGFRTMIADCVTERISPDGVRRIGHSRIYSSDPGRDRVEILDGAGGSVTEILISSLEQGAPVEVRLNPSARIAHRMMTTLPGSPAGQDTGDGSHRIADLWMRLRQITQEKTRSIGRREIEGRAAAGFRMDLRELGGPVPPEFAEARVAVWVRPDSGVPVAMEITSRGADGSTYRASLERIEWDTAIDESLFDVTLANLDGWQIIEVSVETRDFTRTRLADGVTLAFGLPGAEPILTEADVDTVRRGSAEASRRVDAAGRGLDPALPRVIVELELRAAARQRMLRFTQRHLGEQVVLDFNGELRVEARLAAPMEDVLALDISSLGKTLEQFERDYLRPANRGRSGSGTGDDR